MPLRSTLKPALEDDARSTFVYRDIKLPYSFSLARLNVVVNTHFCQECVLRKLAEGGSHKVYEVFAAKAKGRRSDQSLDAVVRVASPVFPGDKMRSEIATLAYIRAHTCVPVPIVYAWNTDLSNTVGAEWMIMQKIPGIIPYDPWTEDVLPIEVKLNVVRQVARHFRELFSLRFAKAGSIYFTSDAYSRSSDAMIEDSVPQFKIGPVVSTAFFQCVDGKLDYPSTDLHSPGSPSFAALHALRGPFTHTAEFLTHEIRAHLFKYEAFPQETLDMSDTASCNSDDSEADLSDNEQDNQAEDQASGQENNSQETGLEALERAKRIMKKAIEVCDIYRGDAPVWDGGVSTPDQPFTLHWYDFRLANILIDEKTGTVNGYIDFEGAVTVPLWLTAEVIDWVPDPMTDRNNWWGGTRADQFRLWKTFHSTMDAFDDDGEWRKAYEGGKYFREWAGLLGYNWDCWAEATSIGARVDQTLVWASKEGNRGVGRLEIDEKSGKSWEELEREYILRTYGPDPIEAEAE